MVITFRKDKPADAPRFRKCGCRTETTILDKFNLPGISNARRHDIVKRLRAMLKRMGYATCNGCHGYFVADELKPKTVKIFQLCGKRWTSKQVICCPGCHAREFEYLGL